MFELSFVEVPEHLTCQQINSKVYTLREVNWTNNYHYEARECNYGKGHMVTLPFGFKRFIVQKTNVFYFVIYGYNCFANGNCPV